MSDNQKAFLEHLAIAPEGHMDASMLPKFKALSEKEDRKAVDLLKLLDECVHGSLCSAFCVGVMEIAWQQMLLSEGKTEEQGIAEATWRHEAAQ